MKVALIGLGMVAGTHVSAISDSSEVQLHGVLGRRRETTRNFAAKVQDETNEPVKGYERLADLTADREVDFVVLATPPNVRLDIVSELVSAGKPILMEKPIERTWHAARNLVNLCAQSRVPLGIVLQHRARAASIALKNAIEQGDLGEIASAEIRVPWWREQSYYDEPGRGTYDRDGGGVMISQAIHTLDLALWLLGPFKSVQAFMCRTPLHDLEAEDWAGALFETMGGAVGTLNASTAAYPGTGESITLHGTRGSAHLADGVCRLVQRGKQTVEYGQSAATGSGADPMAFTHAWHQTIIDDFAKSLIEKRPPLASGQSALAAQAVIHAMTIASQSGQRTEVPQP